jgi:hypothetical protein
MTIKYTKWPQNLPNDRKIDQMAIKYVDQYLTLHDPPKFTLIVVFWFEKIPSGNPGFSSGKKSTLLANPIIGSILFLH